MFDDPAVAAAASLLAQNRVSEAADAVNRIIQNDPQNVAALHLLGRIAFTVDQVERAAELIMLALTGAGRLPTRWLMHADAAVVQTVLGRLDDAVESYRAALVFNPTLDEASQRMAALLRKMGRSEEADAVMDGEVMTLSDASLKFLLPLPIVPGAAPPAMPASNDDAALAQAFPGVIFGDGVQCLGIASIRIGAGSCVADQSWLNVCVRDEKPRMVIGPDVLIGRRAVLSSGTYLEIGAFTIFGPNVYVSSAEHAYDGNHLRPIIQNGIRDFGSLIVEENCWLGMNAVVSGGITVGRGSVVGANSVLRESIPPFSVAVGSPARIVRQFNPETGIWENVRSAEDLARITAARARLPLPSREAYRAQMTAANAGRAIHPAVAGRGVHLP